MHADNGPSPTAQRRLLALTGRGCKSCPPRQWHRPPGRCPSETTMRPLGGRGDRTDHSQERAGRPPPLQKETLPTARRCASLDYR